MVFGLALDELAWAQRIFDVRAGSETSVKSFEEWLLQAAAILEPIGVGVTGDRAGTSSGEPAALLPELDFAPHRAANPLFLAVGARDHAHGAPCGEQLPFLAQGR